MTRVFEDNGTEVMVTVIEVQPHVVIGHRTSDKDGYEAVIVGVEDYGRSVCRVRSPASSRRVSAPSA